MDGDEAAVELSMLKPTYLLKHDHDDIGFRNVMTIFVYFMSVSRNFISHPYSNLTFKPDQALELYFKFILSLLKLWSELYSAGKIINANIMQLSLSPYPR